MKSLFTSSIAAYSLFFAAVPVDAVEIGVEVRFSTNEAYIIRDFYQRNPVAQDKGKKPAKSIPPGIAKNLARGKALPPGIAKQALPGALIGRLPPLRDGFDRIVVDGKVLLVEIATQIIHDILVDVILQ